MEGEMIEISSDDGSEVAAVGIRIKEESHPRQDAVAGGGGNIPRAGVLHQRKVYRPEIEVVGVFQRSPRRLLRVPQRRITPARNIDIIDLSDDEDMDRGTPPIEPEANNTVVVEHVETSDQSHRESQSKDLEDVDLRQTIGAREAVAGESSRHETDQPKMTLQETDQPTMALQETDQPKVKLQETNKPKMTLRVTNKPTMALQETDPPKMALQETDEPKMKLQETDEPKMKLQETNKPKKPLQETNKPKMTLQETNKPKMKLQETDEPKMKLQETDKPKMPLQETNKLKKPLQETNKPSMPKKHIPPSPLDFDIEKAFATPNFDWSPYLDHCESSDSDDDDEDVEAFCAAFRKATLEEDQEMEQQELKRKKKILEQKEKKEAEKQQKDFLLAKKIAASCDDSGRRVTRLSSRLSGGGTAAAGPSTATTESRSLKKSVKHCDMKDVEMTTSDDSEPDEDKMEDEKSPDPDISVGRVSDDSWSVEKIIDYRIVKKGVKEPEVQYLTKWEGWAEKFNSWVPGSDFASKLPIEKFWKKMQEEVDELNKPFELPSNYEETSTKAVKSCYFMDD